jgi:hypothetical protein
MKKIFVLLWFFVLANYVLGFRFEQYEITNLPADTLNINTLEYSDSTADGSAYISIYYPKVSGLESTTLESKINRFIEDEFKQSIPWYEEAVTDTFYTEEFPQTFDYTFETGFRVSYNSKDFISIVLDHYQFTGGAHGNYYSVGYNFRTSDANVLTLTDIISSENFDILVDECTQAILEKFEAASLVDAGLFEDELIIPPDQDFYILPGKLILQFDPYEIAPYSIGEISVEIPFSKIQDILKTNAPFLKN